MVMSTGSGSADHRRTGQRAAGHDDEPSTSTIDIESIRARLLPSYVHKYTERDVSLYALSVGCTSQDDMQHLYEAHPAFAALPTFALIAAHPCLRSIPLEHYLPNCDRAKGLHGEQYVELFGPLPTSGQLISKTQLLDAQDKGRNAVVVVRTTTNDDRTGRLLAINEFTLFMLGAGGFGSDWACPPRPAAATATNAPPDRAADAVASERIGEDQAALYRLNGDLNPLHIDPAAAASVGFERPILHGMCTMAVCVRLVAAAMRAGDVGAVRCVKVRFARHVMPGDTLVVEMWRDGPNKVIFRAQTQERGGAAVIAGAAVEFFPQQERTQQHSKL